MSKIRNDKLNVKNLEVIVKFKGSDNKEHEWYWYKQKGYRNWCFTWNNYDDDDLKYMEYLGKDMIMKKLNIKYIIYGKEVGEEKQTPHLQGYICFENDRTLNGIKNNIFGDDGSEIFRVRLEPRSPYSTNDKAIEYCMKEGDYIECGVKLKQGERTDLKELQLRLYSGESVDNLADENPNWFHQYGRTLNKLSSIKINKNVRNKMTIGLWFWGPKGSGKSKFAHSFKELNLGTIYSKSLSKGDSKWWDGYKQEDIVLLEEYRAQLDFYELLLMTDRYEHKVSIRGNDPLQFNSKIVIITSPLNPKELFEGYNNSSDNIAQLLRRFKVFEFKNSVNGKGIINPKFPGWNKLLEEYNNGVSNDIDFSEYY